MTSKAFGTQRPALAHLVKPQGGLSGEIYDLRQDIDAAFTLTETPGAGGTNLVAVEEWVNPAAAVANLFMASTAFTAAAQVLTGTDLTGTAASPPRNVVVGVTITGGVGAGTVTVAGLDYDGVAITEDFTVPAATADVTGAKAFASVTSVSLPAHGAAFTGSVVVGSGAIIGLSSKIKVRNAVPAVLAEWLDGVMVHGGANGAATAVNLVATATNAAMKYAGNSTSNLPIAAELITVVAAADSADGAMVVAAQPDVPRKLQVSIVEGGAAITAGTGTLVGVAWDGTALSQVIDLTGGAKVVDTDDAYASVTSFTVAGLVGGGAATTISIGVGAAIALPIPAGATSVAVFGAFVDGVKEAVGTVDATARTIEPTTPADAAKVFDFNYRYVLTPTQASHNHTQNAHSHTDAAGTFATPTVGAPHGTFTPATAPNGAHDYVLAYERDLT